MACVGSIPSFNSFDANYNGVDCTVAFTASIDVPCGSTGWELRLYRKKGSAPSEQCTEFMQSWNIPDGPTTFSPTISGDDLECEGPGTYYYKLNVECIHPNVYATISDTVTVPVEDPTLGVHPVITIDNETCKFTATCNVTSYCGTEGPPKYKISLYHSLGHAPHRTEEERVPADQFIDCVPGTVAFNWNGNLGGNGVHQFEFVLKKDGAPIASVLVNDKDVTGCDEVYAPLPPQTAMPQLIVDELIYLVQPVKTAQGFTYIDKRLMSQTYQMLDWWYYRRGGCGAFRLLVRENFKEADRALEDGWEIHVRIKLPGEATHTTWYRGVIRAVERKRQANEVLTEIRGQGYLEQLAHIQVQKRYPRGSTIQWIVTDIIRNFICPNSRISRRLTDDGIDASANYVTKGPLHFECSALRAIKFLAELQGDFEFGVAADGGFYFRKKTTSFTDALFETKDIVSTIEGGKELTKINQYKIGGKSYGHEMALNIVKDVTDITAYGLFETPIDIPWIEHRLDANRWADNQLATKKGLTSWRLVGWSDIDKRLERGHPNGSLGMVRIYGTDVSWDFEELDISKIHYQKGGLSSARSLVTEIHNLADRTNVLHSVINAKVYLGSHHYELTEEIEDKIYAPIAALRGQAKQFRNPIVDVTNPNTTQEDTKPGQFWMQAVSDLTNGPFRPRFREDLTNWPDLVKLRFGDVTTPASGDFLGEEFFVYSNAGRTQGTKYYWDGQVWKAMAAPSTAGGGTVTGSGVNGEVAFWNSATNLTSNSKFKYDSTTGRMTLKYSSQAQIRLENSAGTGYVDVKYSSFAYEMFSPSSTDFSLTLYNSNTAQAANVFMSMPLQHATPTGDAYFTVSSALGEWAWGMRSSDSSAFLLCGLGNLNGSNRWRVTTTTQDWYGNSAGSAVFTLQNVNAGSAVGVQQIISVPNTSTTGDVWTTYSITGGAVYSLGIDISENGFVISRDATLTLANQRYLITDFTHTFTSASITSGATFKNINSNSAASETITIFLPATSTTGDASVVFYVFTAGQWAHGLDNSDSDSYVLSNSTVLGTNNRMRVSTAGQVDFYGDVITTLDIKWKSGTAFTATLDHAISADRIYTFPDVAGIVALGTGANGRVAFWTGTNSISSDAGMTYDATNDFLTLTSTVGKQLQLVYASGSVYYDIQVNSTGWTTVNSVGTAPGFQFQGTNSGAWVGITTNNLSNTANSYAYMEALVAGTSAGDAEFYWSVQGAGSWVAYLDNSDSDSWKLGRYGVADYLTITTAGVVSLAGDLWWQSNTAFFGKFAHAISADRTWTFPDVTASVGMLLTGSGTPGATAPEGTFYWDTTGDILYVNNDGITSWSNISPVLTGSSVANRVTYWTGTNTIGGDSGMTYDSPTDTLTVAGDYWWNSGTGFLGKFAHAISAERIWTFPDAAGTVTLGTGTATLVAYWSATNTITGSSGFIFETGILKLSGDIWFRSGTGFEAKLEHGNTGDRTYTFPDASGTFALGSGSGTHIAFWSGPTTLTYDAGMTYDSATDTITLAGDLWWKSGTAFTGKFEHAISADRIWTFPDVAGTVPLGTGTNTYVAYWTATNTIAGDAGFIYTAASDSIALAGFANIGTTVDASAVGDFSVGLTGNAYRMFWDQSDGDLRFFRASTGVANMAIGPAVEDNDYWGIGIKAGISTVSNSNYVIECCVNAADPTLYINSPWASGAINFSVNNVTYVTLTTTGLTVTGTVTVSSLTATRVLYAGTAGLISGDAGMVYDAAADTLTLDGDLWWKSATAFLGKFAHAISAERIWTFPDIAGTVVVNSASQAIDNNARVMVRRNTGADVGARRRLNFIEGTNVTLSVVDDAASEEIDVTITSSAGAADTSGGKWMNYVTFQ